MRRYRDFNSYLREIFGERVQRISLDAGLNCPNRDGTISKLGCIYCDRLGSGTGAMIDRGESIEEQVTKGRILAEKRYGARKFIAYFQSFSNTYGPLPQLKEQYDAALSRPDMVGLFVATRPDCIDSDILEALSSYQKDHLVWIEYGLQSAHDSTLLAINRGHDAACFERAVRMTRGYVLDVCAHVILGLPGETRIMMLETARYLASLPVKGVKIHLLYVVRGTRLADLYERGEFQCLERDEYTELVVDFLELLRPDMIIQRLTGDPAPSELVAPEWAKEKSRNLALIRQRLEERDTWQGRKYQSH
jgi:radical SAM protein (TIGR01212 family)